MSKRSLEKPSMEEPTSSSSPTHISSEHLTLSVFSVIQEVYHALPEAFWGLSRSTDALAPRGFVLDEGESFNIYQRRYVERGGCPFISLRIKPRFNQAFTILPGIKEVYFSDSGSYSSVGYAAGSLSRGSRFNLPLVLPPGIEEVGFRNAVQPTSGPPLPDASHFSHEVVLPPSIFAGSILVTHLTNLSRFRPV